MDASGMLSDGAQNGAGESDMGRQSHQYPTRHGVPDQEIQYGASSLNGAAQRVPRSNNTVPDGPGYPRGSPVKRDQKHVVFQLIDPKDPRIQARLPMRVMISPHDTTDSIITTVKNFYGLYEYGVSFENEDGISIIAAFSNFENNMTVYVRTVSKPAISNGDRVRASLSPKRPTLGAPIEMRPPSLSAHLSPSRSAARSTGLRSVSPQSDIGRRSASAALGGRIRTQRTKSKDNNMTADMEGYSSGDNGSVASSRRSKAEEIKAEITVDNIVEGGRRKRAFESSELPLFVPPQVPMSASISSISPQRRSGPNAASPYAAHSNQQTFSYTQALPSPQSYSNGSHYMQQAFSANLYQHSFQPPSRQLRGGRVTSASYGSNRLSMGGILPTPDPTIGSVISDEDVALQLMRLGDPAAFSHGRTSTSTVDDALSGKADAASSGEEDDREDEQDEEQKSKVPNGLRYPELEPQRKKQRTMNELPSDGTSGEEYEDIRDGTFGSDDFNGADPQNKMGRLKAKSHDGAGVGKPGKPRTLSMTKLKKASVSSKVPMSPASLPPQSRKASTTSMINFQHQLGVDEEDLSSKPRCQRCRKSKKGCDRQRPCGRCKDAGLTAEDCVSEDEGNGRKGRYGRHMGVSVKRAEGSMASLSPPPQQESTAANVGYFLAPALPDKNKKRKR